MVFKEDSEEALQILHYLNPIRGGAPKIVLFGMCLSGAFSEGRQALFDRLAAIKFPTPITTGSLSYMAAPQKWTRTGRCESSSATHRPFTTATQSQMPSMHTDPNDPFPTSKLANDNSLTDLHSHYFVLNLRNL